MDGARGVPGPGGRHVPGAGTRAPAPTTPATPAG